MKQFARCAQCRQWYLRAVTTAVEVCRSDTSRRQVMWCVRCVKETEERSMSLYRPKESALVVASSQQYFEPEGTEDDLSADAYQRCMQEHLHMMERALHEEEEVLVPSIEGFLQRCLTLQEQLELPEQIQRLQGCGQYWETFLRVLKQ